MSARVLVLALLLGVLAVPAPASADAPFTIGVGVRPHVLTDAATGTAHVVWADGNLVRYCRVPRGAAACDATAALAAGVSVDHPFLVYGLAGTLYIGLPDYVMSDVFLWASVDGGATWGARRKIYDYANLTEWTEPIFDAVRGELIFGGSNPGRAVFGATFDGGHETWSTHASLGDGGNAALDYDVQVVPRPGGGYVAVGDDLHATFAWYTAPGTDPSLGPWTAPVAVGDGDTVHAAGDVNGTYVMATAGAGANRAVVVRRWAGTTFGASVTVAAENGYMNDLAIAPSGALAAVWRRNGSPNKLRLGASSDNGATWTVTTIAEEDVVMDDMDVSIANDRRGWAVYEGAAVTGSTNHIRLATTDEVPAPPPTPPAPVAPPPAAVPAPQPLPVTPRPVSRVRTATAAVRGATLQLTYPRQCIPAGRPFTVRLTWKKQRRKGNVFVKVRRTDFYIGTKRLKIDRKAPFVQTLKIARPRRGATYTLRARAFIKVRRGKAPTKSIRVKLSVCA